MPSAYDGALTAPDTAPPIELLTFPNLPLVSTCFTSSPPYNWGHIWTLVCPSMPDEITQQSQWRAWISIVPTQIGVRFTEMKKRMPMRPQMKTEYGAKDLIGIPTRS